MNHTKNAHILLIDCQDELGIVHRVTGTLYRHGLNIDDQGEFVERESRRFFMRTEISGEVKALEILKELSALELQKANISLFEKRKKEIVVFVSKEAHCLGDLLIRHAYGELQAQILAVVSNHSKLEDLVSKFSIPFHYLPHEGKDREKHEAGVIEVVDRYQPEYIVLAKYMRVLSPAFVARYRNQMINIHHSFLPAFAGARPYHQAFEKGVKIIGATAHFVSEDLDEGPIIAQDVIPTAHDKDPEDMIHAGRDVEKTVLASALRLVFEDRVFVHQRKTIIFD